MSRRPSVLIIDGNNWFRRRAESSKGIHPLLNCYNFIESSPQDVIFLVWDGMKSLQKRREIYPEYKKTRHQPGESFFMMQQTFKTEIAPHSKAIIYDVPYYEGDDVIAFLIRKHQFDNKTLWDSKIESNDADFACFGMAMARDTFKVEPQWVNLYKIVVGDQADNIKGIKGFGKQAWENATLEQKQNMKNFLDKPTLDYKSLDLPEKFKNHLLQAEQAGDILKADIFKYKKIVDFIYSPVLENFKPLIGTSNRQEAYKIINRYTI